MKTTSDSLNSSDNMEDSSRSSRMIFRETKFDRSTNSFLKVLAGVTACMLLPIAAAATAIMLIRREYGLQPGSSAASACGWLFVAAIIISCVSTYYFARNNAAGNKYKYFVLDEKGRLMYTNAGKGAIFAYYSKNVPMSEKLKATPNALFGITFFHGLKPFYSGFSYMRMEQFFKYNQKHKLAELLLSGNSYQLYCRQIVSVSSIKFFRNGCTVVFSSISNGNTNRETCHIYTSMNGYETVVGCMLQLMNKKLSKPQYRLFEMQQTATHNAPYAEDMEAASMKPLSAPELHQARKLIIRKNVIALVCAAIFLLLAVLSLMQWRSTAEKSEHINAFVFSKAYAWLSARAHRRAYICLLWIIMSASSAFKSIREWFSAKQFVKTDVTLLKYIAPEKKLSSLLDDYRYKASVEYFYAGRYFTAVLGVSRTLWDNRENGNAALVMKNDTPCFLIMEKPEANE